MKMNCLDEIDFDYLCSHNIFREVVLLQLHAHLNSVFAHFVEFHLRFHTLEEKELEVVILCIFNWTPKSKK